MQKTVFGMALGTALLLAGCGGGNPRSSVVGSGENTVDFSESAALGTRPSLLHEFSNDGTINRVLTLGDSFANPEKAINTMDGASLSQPIILKLGSDNGEGLVTPKFQSNPLEVYLLEVAVVASSDGTKVKPAGILNILSPSPTQPGGPDFTVIASGSQLIIYPAKPLNPNSYYTYFITDSLMDNEGFSIKASADYLSYAGRSSASVSKVRKSVSSTTYAGELVKSQEGLLAQLGGIVAALNLPLPVPGKTNIILSDTFKTASVGDEFAAIKYAAHKLINDAIDANGAAPVTTGSDVWVGGDKLGNSSLAGIYTLDLGGAPLGTISEVLTDSATSPAKAKADPVLNSSLGTAQALDASLKANPNFTAILAGWNVYRTTVKLPYFQGVPELIARADLGYSANPAVVITNSHWQAAMPSLAAIKNELNGPDDEMKIAVTTALTNAGLDANELKTLLNNPSTSKSDLVTRAMALVGTTISASGKQLDSDRFITEWNPLPALTKLVSVPVLMFATAAGLNTVSDIIVFQHGITASKESAYAIAVTLIAEGKKQDKSVAVIAIDHPIHGERGFDLIPGGAKEITASSAATATVYMNLAYLTVGRDNIRQSIADLLGLRASIGFANAKGELGVAGMRVSFLGHSLGGITGTNFLAAASAPTYTTADNSLFEITATGLAMPGGNIASLLQVSPAFGNLIKFTVGASNPAVAAGFAAYAPACQTAIQQDCFVNEFLPVLAAQDIDAWVAINDGVTRFVGAAQTVIDVVDPMSVAGSTHITDEPVYLVEIVGDGTADNKQDQVITNAAATEPLVRELGLSALSETVAETPVRRVGRFKSGGHGSLLKLDGSDEGAVLSEIQTQFGGFFATAGTAVSVGNAALLCTGSAAECVKE